MTFAELNKATDNFSSDNIIGLGKMGTVHKATLLMVCFLQLRDYMTLNSWRNNSCVS